ncbi:MAG: CBS domain-containing protein [Desulfurococcaceae archaeon]
MMFRKPPFKRKEYRWLRSDGTPNFDNRVYSITGDMEIIAKRDVVSVSPTTPVEKALDIMSKHYRSLLVTLGGELKGVVFATTMVNYLGGGDLFGIVANRYNYNIFRALKEEVIENLMVKNPIVAYIDMSIVDVLELMVVNGIGLLPVVHRDGRVFGVVSEHDLVRYLYGIFRIGVRAEEIMSTPIITCSVNDSLWNAMRTMVKYGFRRLPVVDSDGSVVGIVTAMDIVRFFNPSIVYSKLTSSDIREVLQIPVMDVASKRVVAVEPGSDLSVIVKAMVDNDVSSVLVVDSDGKLHGIISERDVLYALTVKEIR